MSHRLTVTLLAAALLASMTACQKSETPTAAPAADTAATAADTAKADAAFADLSKRAREGWLQLSPVSATQIGEHKYDGELDDLSAAGRQKGLAFSKKILAELDATDTAALSRENQVDAAILREHSTTTRGVPDGCTCVPDHTRAALANTHVLHRLDCATNRGPHAAEWRPMGDNG